LGFPSLLILLRYSGSNIKPMWCLIKKYCKVWNPVNLVDDGLDPLVERDILFSCTYLVCLAEQQIV
jgi:hypothetical protein